MFRTLVRRRPAAGAAIAALACVLVAAPIDAGRAQSKKEPVELKATETDPREGLKKARKAFDKAIRKARTGLEATRDPLPSWRKGAVKDRIVSFVRDVSDPDSPKFVTAEKRIAVFDNDGTLWSEKPVYFQLLFALDRIRALAPSRPEWKTTQPFKAALENDMKALAAAGHEGLLELIAASHAGMSVARFREIVSDWISTSKHPRFDRRYTELIFQPMMELLAFLRARNFKTFIVSGGGIDFMRPWVPEVYGVPVEQIVGSRIKLKFELKDGKPMLMRLPELDFLNDKAGKPVGMNTVIGRRPILAVGNSDGDFEMLQWTTSGEGARLGVIVRHTDGEREWAYDRESPVGRLDRALDAAEGEGWAVVDMKRDWAVVFPFQGK